MTESHVRCQSHVRYFCHPQALASLVTGTTGMAHHAWFLNCNKTKSNLSFLVTFHRQIMMASLGRGGKVGLFLILFHVSLFVFMFVGVPCACLVPVEARSGCLIPGI